MTIHVLIAEDSKTVQLVLKRLIEADDNYKVVGIANNGEKAVELAKELKPDIITMDIQMPVLDGYESTKSIMEQVPTPIVMVSSKIGKDDADAAYNAMRVGALSIFEKPAINIMADPIIAGKELRNHLKLMSNVKVFARFKRRLLQKAESQVKDKIVSIDKTKDITSSKNTNAQVICIASSTGGPNVLLEILCKLPKDFPIPIFIVQHITKGFGDGFVQWLDEKCDITIKVGKDGELASKGCVYFAPDYCHMKIMPDSKIALEQSEPVDEQMPSGNILFESCANSFRSEAMGIILTGMGKDGARGLAKMHNLGAATIAQDEESSIVFGMPKVAIDMGCVDYVLNVKDITSKILTA